MLYPSKSCNVAFRNHSSGYLSLKWCNLSNIFLKAIDLMNISQDHSWLKSFMSNDKIIIIQNNVVMVIYI